MKTNRHLTLRYAADQGRGFTLHPSADNRFYLPA
jgi:hypothetical protein